MAPLSLNRHALLHALVGWGILLTSPMAGAFVVPKNAGMGQTLNSPFRSSRYMVPPHDGSRYTSYPRVTVGSATEEQVAAAEAALQAEVEAVMRRSDPFAAFAATIDIGNATPQQVAEAQAALDAELAAARAGQSQPRFPVNSNNNNKMESRFPFQSPFMYSGQSTGLGTSETDAAETKAVAALQAVIGGPNKMENHPFAPPPPLSRPFPPTNGMANFSNNNNNNNTPALNMARAGVTPALQNAAKRAAIPAFGNMARGVAPAGSNSQQSVASTPGTPAMDIAHRMAPAGSAGVWNNDNNNVAKGMAPTGGAAQNDRQAQPTANGSPAEVKIDASSGNIPWFGQRAASSTIQQSPSSMKAPWFTSPPASSSPFIQTATSMSTDDTATRSTEQNVDLDAPTQLDVVSSQATATVEEQSSNQQATIHGSTSRGFSFSFPSFTGFSAKPSSVSTDAFENDSIHAGSTEDSVTSDEYSSEPNQSSYSDNDGIYARYDPVPPNVEPPHDKYWEQSYSFIEPVETTTDETAKPNGPLENFWLNTLSQQQRVQLNRAAVKVVEYSLPVTAATVYLLSNNAEPLRNAEAAVEHLTYSAIPTAYQEWISEDKTRGLTAETNYMSQYMDRMDAPWALDANGNLVLQVPAQESAGAMRAEIVAPSADVMPSQPDVTEQEPQPQWDAEGATSSYSEYMEWRSQQESQTQDQFSPTPEQLSTVNPDAAVAAGVSSILSKPYVSEPSTATPTYADQMWSRAMTVPQAPERTFNQDVPPSQQAPSQADNWWQQAMTVPPAPLQAAKVDLPPAPASQQGPSLADNWWQQAMTVPAPIQTARLDATPVDENGAPAPIDAHQQQFARDMQAMTTEANANPNPEFPPGFVPELEYNGPAVEPVFEEEVSPVMWSSHDYYYGYREDVSLF